MAPSLPAQGLRLLIAIVAGGACGWAVSSSGFGGCCILTVFWVVGPLACGRWLGGHHILGAVAFNLAVITVPLWANAEYLANSYDVESTRAVGFEAVLVLGAIATAQLARVKIPKRSGSSSPSPGDHEV